MHRGVREEWNTSKHAWKLSNGIRTVWCYPDEYNETIEELEEELSSEEL